MLDKITEYKWVCEREGAEDSASHKMIQRKISYVPALFKIFSQLLVYAASKFNISKINMVCNEFNIFRKDNFWKKRDPN